MKALFIGGTGNISAAVSRLALEHDVDLYLLNRGRTDIRIPGAKSLVADIHRIDEVRQALSGHTWDVVVNWIAFTEEDIERDIELFRGRTGQYIFIGSASCYQKPLEHPVITESTPLANPYWQYSRDKIACEEMLNLSFREEKFPATIVRPSLTYETVIPMAIGGWDEYTVVDRIKKGKKIIVHGDGSSLWTITHSEDFARGFIPLMGMSRAIGEAFHITSDEILTWNQIYMALADAVGKEANIVHIPSDFICRFDDFHVGNLLGDKAVSVIFDNSKIKSFVPDFQALIPFAEGINKSVDWFEADEKRKVIKKETNELMDRIINAYELKLEDITS
jgi:nucleoside-diphosphate-sugar epimerase